MPINLGPMQRRRRGPSEGHPRLWINDLVGAQESRAVIGTKITTGGALHTDYETYVAYLSANWATDFSGVAIYAALGYAFVYTMWNEVTGLAGLGANTSRTAWGDRANAMAKTYITVITATVGEGDQESIAVVYDLVNDRLSPADKVFYANWFKTADNLTGGITAFGVTEVNKRLSQLIGALALHGDGVLFTGGASADVWALAHVSNFGTKYRSTVGVTRSASELGGNDGTSPIGVSYDSGHQLGRAFRAEEAYRTANGISRTTHYGGTSGVNDARYFRYATANMLYRLLPWAPADAGFPGGRQYRIEKGWYMVGGQTIANEAERVFTGAAMLGAYTGVDSDIAGLARWLLENRIGTNLSSVNHREQVSRFIFTPSVLPASLSPTALGLPTSKAFADGRCIYRQDWTTTAASMITFEAAKWMRDGADHDGYWPGAFQCHRNGPAIVNQGGVGSHDWGMGGFAGSANILIFPDRSTATLTNLADDMGGHRRGYGGASNMRGAVDFIEDSPADRRGRNGQASTNELRSVIADQAARFGHYVYADLTRAYSSEDYVQPGRVRKIQSYIRQMVTFLGATVATDPDVLFIFDRATVSTLDRASGSVKMEWIYHTSGEPIVTGHSSSAAGPLRGGHTQGHTTYSGGSPVITGTNTVNGSNNKCWLTPLLPVVDVVKIWGPNGSGQSWQADSHEYETPYGVRYSNNYNGTVDTNQYDAQGRIELHPVTHLDTNYFLNVVEVAPSSSASRSATSGGATATMAYAAWNATRGACFPIATSAMTAGTFLVAVSGTYKWVVVGLNPSASRTFTPGSALNIEAGGAGVAFVGSADSQGTIELDIVCGSNGTGAANTVTVS